MEFLSKLHPVVVHFPAALFFTYTLFEIINAFRSNNKFHFTVYLILCLAIIAAVISVLTGNQAHAVFTQRFSNQNNAIESLIETHENFATITLWYYLFLLIFKSYFHLGKKYSRQVEIIITLFALIGLYFVYQTGFYGGELVFKYGVGTKIFLLK